MTLTFTCSISIASTHQAEIRQLLIGAIGCNLAWGIVDATMYLIGVLAHKSRSKMILQDIQQSTDAGKSHQYISDALPPILASVIENEELEEMRNKLLKIPERRGYVRLTAEDINKAIRLFLLVFISTFPVVLPFIFIRDAGIALRVSNGVAILMMFLCGWSVARYVGFSKWKMGAAMIVLGFMMVAITIALGG